MQIKNIGGLLFVIALILSSGTAGAASAAPSEEPSDSSESQSAPEGFVQGGTTSDTQWIEIDETTANRIESGDIEAIEKYYNSNGDVDPSAVLSDFPTEANQLAYGSSSAQRSTPKNPDGCELLPVGSSHKDGPMYMHKRTGSNSTGNGYGTIGWKPVTKCKTTPKQIANENRFYRSSLGGWYPQADGKKGSTSSVKEYTQKDVKWSCQNLKREDWRGITVSTITASDNKSYAAKQTTNTINLPCGTK
ncbi:MAG: hypothetical protein ACTHW1_01810 [Ancrocorticia sp.]|uniref:hypothetical protein n=1 Tax=Ancrocorticia sp. TaxID=2593684 RepID=UPI003F9296F4